MSSALAWLACATVAQAGPTSALYLSEGGRITVVQGNAIIDTWLDTTGPTTGFDANIPIAVGATVRTYPQGADNGSLGNEYSLTGTPTGTVYANMVGCCFRDGASDGTYNYAIRVFPGFNNQIYRFGLDWSNPELFFSDASLTSNGIPNGLHIGKVTGITVDPRNGSLWLVEPGSTVTVINISLGGELLGYFFPDAVAPAVQEMALAFDAADETLWLTANQGLQRTLYQYAPTTSSHFDYPALSSMVIPGPGVVAAEFAVRAVAAVPEPAALGLLGLGVLGLAERRRKRA